MKYSSKIRTIRLIKDIQSKTMASALKMTTTNYSKVESDKINLSEENLESAAKELGVSVDFIKNLPKDFLSLGHNNHQEENAKYEVHHTNEKLIEMLQSALQVLKEENVYLRNTNSLLIEKLLDKV
jgi:transcriptional regulator with XRE-family HTH domain